MDDQSVDGVERAGTCSLAGKTRAGEARVVENGAQALPRRSAVYPSADPAFRSKSDRETIEHTGSNGGDGASACIIVDQASISVMVRRSGV